MKLHTGISHCLTCQSVPPVRHSNSQIPYPKPGIFPQLSLSKNIYKFIEMQGSASSFGKLLQ